MKRLTVIVLCLALAGAAHAGRSCEEKPTDAATLVKSMDLAQKTLQALDKSGAQVALVARAGQYRQAAHCHRLFWLRLLCRTFSGPQAVVD